MAVVVQGIYTTHVLLAGKWHIARQMHVHLVSSLSSETSFSICGRLLVLMNALQVQNHGKKKSV
jgi:hypothetical protein